MSVGKRIHHIGIVVDNLGDAVSFLTDTVGLDLSRTLDIPERGGLKAAFFPWGNAELELIEVSEQEARRARLGDSAARIEHIAVEVDDLAATAASLAAKGVQFTTPEPLAADGMTFFFSRPETSDGVMYQFLQLAG